jgi:DNA polymerase IV
MAPTRKIIHIDIDMNAFFAAVEQRDFPQYRNKPIIVGVLLARAA